MKPIISLHTEGLTLYEHRSVDKSGHTYFEYYVNDRFVFGVYDQFGPKDLMKLYINGYFNVIINDIRKGGDF